MTWKVKQIKSLKLKNPILLEGLPGIGNVGKIAIDFLVDELNAVKIAEFSSFAMPHTVFVNEENIIETPSIELYYKKINKQDFIFLIGDTQPINEESCYEFCYTLLRLLKKFKAKLIITTGGIGLTKMPKMPKVYISGTSKKIIEEFSKGIDVEKDLYRVVGPITGVAGLLIGLARKEKMQGIALLAETYSHPLYLGIKASKELIKVIAKKFNFKINLGKLDREIANVEKEFVKTETISRKEIPTTEETSYIG